MATWRFPWDATYPSPPNAPQPYICGKSGSLVEAQVDIPPPNQVSPNEIISVLIIVKVEPRPNPDLWGTTEVEMTVTRYGDQDYEAVEMASGGLVVDWVPDALFFVFKDVSFPKVGGYKLKFEVLLDSYLDCDGNPDPPAELWPQRLAPGPDDKDFNSYCAGLLEVPLIRVIEGLTVGHETQRQSHLSVDDLVRMNNILKYGREA